MFSFSIQDLAKVVNPWTCIASTTLLIRDYRGLLTRLGYFGLLFYWYVFISKDLSMYLQLLPELIRSKRAGGSETDIMGKHWTLNIADQIILVVLSHALHRLFPTHFWKNTGFVTVLDLFVLGHHVVQLWIQTHIARLVRFNRNIWRWRDWAIDTTALSALRRIDHPVTHAVFHAFWWTLYQLSCLSTPDFIDRLTWVCFMMRVWFSSDPKFNFLSKCIRNMFFYRIWFQNLMKFTNPYPPDHEYTALAEPEDIRVILLYPRFGFGKICCSLLQGPHMRLLFYEAISYNWGTMDTTEEVLVDGCRKMVTKSVYEILTSSSSLFLPKLLWIDALCIDQNNDSEKSQQVPMMRRIYRNAIFTTVFLGQSPLPGNQGVAGRSIMPFRYDGLRSADEQTQTYFKDAQLTFDLLQEFHIHEGNALRDNDMTAYQMFEGLNIVKSKRRQWAALLKMLQHPWFERVWVVQEVALSTKVQVRYGDEIIDWETLAKGVEKLNYARSFRLWLELEHGVLLRHIENTSLYNIWRMNQFRDKFRPRGADDYSIYGYEGKTYDLGRALSDGAYFKATNPCDLIYGLMSLCTNPVRIDYTLSVEDVYLDAARELISKVKPPSSNSVGFGSGAESGTRDLSARDRIKEMTDAKEPILLIMHVAGVGNRPEATPNGPKLPSWVPDWRTTPKFSRLKNALEWRETEFKAGGEGFPSVLLKNRTLALSGYHIDVIAEIGPALFNASSQAHGGTLDEMHHLANNYDACWDLFESSPYLSNPYPHAAPGQTLHEAFKRTLFLDIKKISFNHSAEEFLASLPAWEDCFKFFRNLDDARAAEKDVLYELLGGMDMITEKIKSCCGGRHVFTTRKGYIGLCPPLTKPGDLIYVLPGLHVPILLRGTATPGDLSPPSWVNAKRYELVGESYVHGLMNGEALSIGITKENLEII